VISISGESSRILKQGTELQLITNVTKNSTSTPVMWTSSNKTVANVTADGLVTANLPGNSIITVTTKDGYTVQVLVTVEPQTEISIQGEATRVLTRGQEHQLIANVAQNIVSKPINWTTSDEKIATVSADGLIIAQNFGNAIITATTKDGYTVQVIVTVVRARSIFTRWLTMFRGWLTTPFHRLWNALVGN
jgi:uncharacterized protein YjdB